MKHIPDNNSFCLAPWTNLHVLPDGKTMPCCFWSQAHISDNFGNINDYDTAKDLMNHDGFKDLRKKFLKGEKHSGCEKCHNHEDNGRALNGRNYFNRYDSEKTIESVKNTQEDGTASPNIVCLDIRFGNICNLKCRMCGYELSSSWHDDVVKLEALADISVMNNAEKHSPSIKYFLNSDNLVSQQHKPKFIHVDCYDKIEQYLQFAEEIHFAGGEPLLYPEHTIILDKLIETNNTDCILRYNTNLSTLKHKGRDIIDLWNKFETVQVGASIDAMQEGVEFIRSNLKWSVFEKNYNRIRSEAPNVDLTPATAIGILNVEIYPKFNRYCIENNWSQGYFMPNFVDFPAEQNMKILPGWYKERICLIYEQHIEWIEERIQDPTIEYSGENQIEGLRQIISFVQQYINDQETNLALLDDLWQNLWAWKIVTPELDWTTQLPELYAFFMEFRVRHRGFEPWPDEDWAKMKNERKRLTK